MILLFFLLYCSDIHILVYCNTFCIDILLFSFFDYSVLILNNWERMEVVENSSDGWIECPRTTAYRSSALE